MTQDEKDPLVYTPRPELVGLNPSLARVDSVQTRTDTTML